MPQITEDTSIRDVAVNAESRSRKRRIILIVSAAVVLALAATGGTVFWHHTQTVAKQNAFSSCKKSASRYAKVKKQYDSAIQSANLLTTIPTSELADASTVDMLKSELSSTYDFIPTTQCVVSLSTTNLTQAAEQNNKNASAMEKSLKSLTKASDAVTKAHDAQTTSIVSAAKQALQTAIEQATKLLESSKGNVSHEQTRTDLQKTVDDANALLQNDDATIEQLTEAREAMARPYRPLPIPWRSITPITRCTRSRSRLQIVRTAGNEPTTIRANTRRTLRRRRPVTTQTPTPETSLHRPTSQPRPPIRPRNLRPLRIR